jgi:hypothetical protein
MAPFRPEPDIDPEKRGAWRRKDLDYFLSQPGEKFVVGKSGIDVAVVAVKENKIDIGAVVQLHSPELPHGKNTKSGLGTTPFFREMLVTGRVDFVDTVLGDRSDIASGLREPGESRDLAKTDSQHFFGFPGSQFAEREILCRPVAAPPRPIGHFWVLDVRVAEPFQKLWAPADFLQGNRRKDQEIQDRASALGGFRKRLKNGVSHECLEPPPHFGSRSRIPKRRE